MKVRTKVDAKRQGVLLFAEEVGHHPCSTPIQDPAAFTGTNLRNFNGTFGASPNVSLRQAGDNSKE